MSKKEMCVFTIVQNDEWMINKWHNYYSQHFCQKDIYILDHYLHGKGCAGQLGCNIIPLTYSLSFDHDWLRKTVVIQQRDLLNDYNKVLFAEADEFVVPDPNKFSGLKEYIVKFKSGVKRTKGYNVVHMPDEPRINLNESILKQRTCWSRSNSFDKPLLATVPVEYYIGFHNCVNETEQDPNLYLVHLKWMCKDYLLEKNIEICKREWNEYDWSSGRGFEHKAIDPLAIHKLYTSMETPKAIPERFRGLL